jgi:hypothetical protein
MVKQAKRSGLHAIAITDHERLFPRNEERRLTREFGVVVIPGIEGGNIAVQKHWIALMVTRQINDVSISRILRFIWDVGGVSIAPHPHCRPGYASYAELGFDAVEALNGTKPFSNARIRNTRSIPEVAGSDAHSLPMLGSCWTHTNADADTGIILETVRNGRCTPTGTTISFLDYLRFYPLHFKNQILSQPSAAFAALCQKIRNIRVARKQGSVRAGHAGTSGRW